MNKEKHCQLCTIVIGGNIDFFDEANRVFVTRPRLEQKVYNYGDFGLCRPCYIRASTHPEQWYHRAVLEFDDAGELVEIDMGFLAEIRLYEVENGLHEQLALF